MPEADIEPRVTEVIEATFVATRLFWVELLVDPRAAAQKTLPDIARLVNLEYYMTTQDAVNVEKFTDIFCDTTNRLTDTDHKPFGLEGLPYSPLECFGRPAVAKLVEMNYNPQEFSLV